ncbi:bifunctional folylpolyglutamate synthase/dihydrofolate synthase [Tepiditoga spiralis]|uniref:Dihydrofolate synthase/folylpolyglutamate synthase n=1 Tax=Tepiditoga spiralis TaxID=2108365 RepID=A0A7G1G2H4_9BACT|nr:folylpolyglutamate synthase/dihydrofolate synthase family protein [Tepiditoga spiralis]BBE30478.1 bifunctional folylpolyglutamate synthase/dihydrofolate synthase [Tepiditoga spiralis]
MKEFKELVEFLYGKKAGSTKIKLGLERIKKFCEILDNPQNSYKVIHVAGTNGKGSVTKALSTILKEQGYKVGTFISPHLVDINERIRINGKNISNEDFVQLYKEIEPYIERIESGNNEMSPSFFEIITAMAFQYFKNEKVDIAIVEVGLGGRLDSTNVVESDVAVITTIAKDHTKILGESLEEIAHEKAGIIKNNSMLVIGDISESPRDVIIRKAEIVGAKAVKVLGKHFNFKNTRYSLNWNSMDFKYEDKSLNELIFRCNGAYQPHNISVALAATYAFAEKNKININEEKLRKAVKNFIWEGRFELIEKNNKKIILEGAHNMAGIEMFEKTINMYMPFAKKVALIGILDDKDFEEMVKRIGPLFSEIIVTTVTSTRSENPELVYESIKKYNSNVRFVKDPIEAYEKLLKKDADYYFVTGSLYLIGEIRGHIVC